MVCIAAFIILILVGLVVAFLSIFNRDLGKKYLSLLKKSWYCFSKKVRLQKCDTNFQEDVKTMLLKKVVLKHPKWVKPLSNAIEVASILIVVITIWSVVEGAKAGMALWVFGTCNVSQPSSCALGAESCSIDAEDPKNPAEWVGRWFSEWGQIFEGVPDRLREWRAEDYLVAPALYYNESENPVALDIIDPGCSVCLQSYRNQIKDANFMNSHSLAFLIYPIELPDDGGYKFKNSGVTTRYLHALTLSDRSDLALKILNRLFTETDEDHIIYQTVLNETDQPKQLLEKWLKEWGLNDKEIKQIAEKAESAEVTERMEQIKDVVENQVHAKGIPTLIYDGKKHLGRYNS